MVKYNNITPYNMPKTKKTPRQEAEDITKGKTAPHHIGPKSKEVLLQEIWSLDNTKEAFRKGDHYTKRKILTDELRGKFGIEYSESEWRNKYKPEK